VGGPLGDHFADQPDETGVTCSDELPGAGDADEEEDDGEHRQRLDGRPVVVVAIKATATTSW